MQNYLRFAIETAKEAGQLLMQNRAKIQTLEGEVKTDLKINVDKQSDELIRNRISENFPRHNIFSEENYDKAMGSEYSWVVDPLDGTIPYAFGISDHFGVSIALVNKGKPTVGVVCAPEREELYFAQKGRGAFLNGEKISVSSKNEINESLVALDYGKINRETTIDLQRKLLSKEGVMYTPVYGCASVSLGLVAKGNLHCYAAEKLEPWDMAAGVIINKEAGAKVTNIFGRRWQLEEESIFVANPELHQTIFSLIS